MSIRSVTDLAIKRDTTPSGFSVASSSPGRTEEGLGDTVLSAIPTEVLARHLHDNPRPAAFFYGLTLTLTSILYQALWFYASLGKRLLEPDADPRIVSGITRSFLPGVAFYAFAMVSALFSPWLSVGLYAGIAAFYVLESSVFGRSA